MFKDTVPSRRFEHWGLESNSLHLSRGLVRDLAKHCNEDTENLPRFRPPCGVTAYSCLSDRLHCVGYSTRVELELLGGSVEANGFVPILWRQRTSLYSRPVLLPAQWAGRDTKVGAQIRSSVLVSRRQSHRLGSMVGALGDISFAG